MPKYKVKGKNAHIKHSWVDDAGARQEKVLKEGDEVELTLQQASALKGQLEPLDDEAKAFAESAPSPDLKNLRAHEEDEILAQQEESLQKKLDVVKTRREELKGVMEQEAAARAEKQAARDAKAAESKAQATPGEKKGAGA